MVYVFTDFALRNLKGVGAAISLKLDSSSILTRLSKIIFFRICFFKSDFSAVTSILKVIRLVVDLCTYYGLEGAVSKNRKKAKKARNEKKAKKVLPEKFLRRRCSKWEL